MRKALMAASALTAAASFLNAPAAATFFAAPTKTPETPAEIFAEMQKAWSEFKAANDDNIAKRDVVNDEKVTRINATLTKLETDMKAALDEQAKALARLSVGGGGGGANDNMAAHARAFVRDSMLARNAGAREVLAAMRKAPDVEAYGRYCDAFNELIACSLNANMLSPDMRNALSVGSDPSGGWLVPPTVSTDFLKRVFDTSPMRQVATARRIATDAWEQPLDTADGVSGGWVTEKQARPSTGTPTIGVQRIPVEEQYAYPELTQKMLEDAVLVDPASWLQDKTADTMVRVENASFVTGNGKGKPRGFLDYGAAAVTTADASRAWGVLQYIPIGASGAWPTSGSASNPDALITAVYALKSVYRANARWAMNRMTLASVRKLKDADGNYLWQMGLQAGQPSSLLGYGIAEFEDMPDIAADSLSIAFGDWRQGYSIIDRLGLTVLVDPYTNKPYVGFYMRKRVGGDVTNFDAIKLLKFANS